jgi:hypothetical protein
MGLAAKRAWIKRSKQLAVGGLFASYIGTLLSCTAVPSSTYFSKPATSKQQFASDHQSCYLGAAHYSRSVAASSERPDPNAYVIVHSKDTWLGCMTARGYAVDPHGSLKTEIDPDFSRQ